MLIIFFLLTTLNPSSSVPVPIPNVEEPHIPVAFFGRELVIDIESGRTLQEIVFSCLATIFACTWVAVHPNLPGPWDSEWKKFKRRVAIMMVALLVPEFMTMWAMLQWVAARRIAKRFNEEVVHENAQGIDSHDEESECGIWAPLVERKLDSQDVDSGSESVTVTEVGPCPSVSNSPSESRRVRLLFALKTRWGSVKEAVIKCWTIPRNIILEWFRDQDPRQLQEYRWTTAHGFFIQMGGFILCHEDTMEHVITFFDLERLIERGQVDRPKVTENEISDKSKGDLFTKLLVVLQTTWFIFQCIARWIQRLPVTELEIVTLAFATLNSITYTLWWKKPQNVQAAILVQRKPGIHTEGLRQHRVHGDGRNTGFEEVYKGWLESARARLRQRIEVMERAIARVMCGELEPLLAWMVAMDMAIKEVARELLVQELIGIARELEIVMGEDSREAKKRAREMAEQVMRQIRWDMVDKVRNTTYTLENPHLPTLFDWEDWWWAEVQRVGRNASQWNWTHELKRTVDYAVGNNQTSEVMSEEKAEEAERETSREWAELVACQQAKKQNEDRQSHFVNSFRKLQHQLSDDLSHVRALPKIFDPCLRAGWNLTLPILMVAWAPVLLAGILLLLISRLLLAVFGEFNWLLQPLLRPFRKMGGFTTDVLPTHSLRVPVFWKEETDSRVDFPILAIGVLFGAIHLIPWSTKFPSTLELWLWRSATLVITLEPFIAFLLRFIGAAPRNPFTDSLKYTIFWAPAFCGVLLYLVARCILLILAFATLRALPSDAYKNINWTTFIPHV